MQPPCSDDVANPPNVPDVVARISIENEKIGLSAITQRAEDTLTIEDFCGGACRSAQDIERIESGLLMHDQFELSRNAGKHAGNSGVSTDQHGNAGAVDGKQVNAQNRQSLYRPRGIVQPCGTRRRFAK